MRGDKEMRKIALQIGIALTAGVFSFIPSVSAAPVLNNSEGNLTTSGVNVAVDATDSQITNVTGSQRNNVVDWQDFSVAQGETVRFSGNSSDNIKNYLNLVTGENTSRIDGRLEGGNEVYIVNPNGVIFGNSASVDVGSLYVSSRPIADVDLSGVGDTNTTTDMSPLANTVSMSGNAAAIVNMGDVQATSVSVEGGNIILADVNRIKIADGSAVNTNITLQNIGTDTGISLGHSVTDVVAASNADTLMNATGADFTGGNYSSANKVVSIRNESELENVTTAGLGRNYLLIDDITLTANHTPIGGDTPFTGNFDGQFHTISNVNVSGGTYGGLFGYTYGGTVKSVGVQGGSITASYAGGIAGLAENGTEFVNVFNNGTAINMVDWSSYAGGLVGYIADGKIKSSYNTGNVTADEFNSGGIVGNAINTEIANVYNTGDTTNGLIGSGYDGSLSNAYATQNNLHSVQYTTDYSTSNVLAAPSSKNAADYSGFDISNKGGENTVWRIYEGQTLPLLRSFLTANGTVTVNYNYTHGSESGSNGGADLTTNDLTYNGSYVTVDGTPAYTGANNIDTDKIQHYDSGENGVRNAKTKALFFTGQQGYDLVGNNVTMGKRSIYLSGGNLGITKVYDKSADASTAVQSAFANTTNISGIVAGDDVGISSANITGTYVNDNDVADYSVGTHKVLLGGTVTVTGSDADNYTLEATDLSTLANVTGTITQRPIYLNTTLTDVNFSKTYDGSASVSATNSQGEAVSVSDLISLESTTSAAGTQDPAHGKITGDVVDLDYGTDATTVPRYVDVDSSGNVSSSNAANAGEHSVMFSGIALTGDDAGNYVLCYNGTTDPVTNSQVLLRSGTDINTGAADSIKAVIRPRLLATDGFQVRTLTGTDSSNNPIYSVATANKTYDGTSAYTVPNDSVLIANTAAAGSSTGLLAADSPYLYFNLNGTGSHFVHDANDGTTPTETKMAAGALAANKVSYSVVAETATVNNVDYGYLKGNYTFDSATAASNVVDDWQTLQTYVPSVYGDGTISQREITLVTNGITGIDKPYDGTRAVTGNNNYTTIGGEGALQYSANSAKLLQDDTATTVTDNARWSVTAAYDNKNVVRADDGTVTTNGKTVNFNVSIVNAEGATTDDTVNYILVGADEGSSTSMTFTGRGTITPITLTPNIVDISKTYNGTSAINDGDSSTPSITVIGQTYTDDDSGQTVTDALTVNYDASQAYYYDSGNAIATSNAGTWQVRYPNLTLSGAASVNYDLNSTTGIGAGTINRRLILSSGFQVMDGGTAADGTKVYDGTSIYNVPSGATLVTDTTASANVGIITDDQDKLWFNLSNNATSHFQTDQGVNTEKVADASRIAYQIEAQTADNYAYLLDNYKIGTETSSQDLATNTTYAVTGTGTITRRPLTIVIDNATGIDKVYNNDTDLVNAGDISIGGAYLNYADGSTDENKLLQDVTPNLDTARWNVTAAYDTKDVVRGAGGSVPDNRKTVNFTISLTGTDAANYTLNGQNAESSSLTLTGSGKITPLGLTASFERISKTYTGTTAINDRVSTVTGSGTVDGLGDDDVNVAYSANDAYYDSPDVGTDKTVYYPNLVLTGGNSGNYYLTSTTGIGLGDISAASVDLSAFHFVFADVERVYNGNLAVADSSQGITAEQFITDSYIDLGAGARYDFRSYINNLSANYENANVSANDGTGNVTYSFQLSDITIPNIDITGDYNNYFTQNPVTLSVGTITPKTVYATINNPVVTKTYNGAYDVQATTPLVNYNGLVGNSADATTAVYLDKNQGTDKLVRYDVAISDGSNYIIQYNSADNNMSNYRTAENGPAVTAGTVITTVVTPNNIINAKNLPISFVNITKEYDGTTDVLPVADQVALGTTTTGEIAAGDNITLNSWTAAFNSPDVATADTVSYTNIALSGNDDGNYNFVDGNGNTLTSATVISGVGTITPLALNGSLTFTLGDVTKEYDQGNAIKFTGNVGGTEYYRDGSEAAIKNFIMAPSITVNGNSQQMGYELDMDGTAYDAATVGTQPATFRVGISNSNYNFNNITVYNAADLSTPLEATVENGVHYYNLVKSDATITPRHVHLALNDSPAITKIYDGTLNVEQTVTGNNNKVYMTDSTDFLQGDNVAVDWDNISAVYENENAGNQNVLYTVALTGTDAGNYELYTEDNTAITDANKLTGTGVIEKRQLTIDFARDEHSFDNSAYLTNPGSNLRLGNLADRDAGFDLDDLAKALIGGRYTDKDVNRADDGTVLDKGLTYNNLQSALTDYAARNAIASNYTMAADSVTYSVSDAKGVITPMEITAPLKAVWQTGVNKIYDATTNLPQGTDANSVLTLQVNTTYDGALNLQGGDAGYQYDEDSAGYVSKDQGDRALTYTITAINPNQGNYQLADSVVTNALGEWQSTDTAKNVGGASVTGHISPRTIDVVAETDSKIYDGTRNVANAKDKIHFSAADQAVIDADTDGVDYTVAADYVDKNAADGITINYTLALTGNNNGNYVLGGDSVIVTGNSAVGTTTGDIEKRKVYVEPVDVTGIDKEYDTTRALPSGYSNAGRFQLAATDDDTGIVVGEEDIQLDMGAIQGSYEDKHAGDWSIGFSNFTLQDTDTTNDDSINNYVVETTELSGSGTIYAKALTVGINTAPIKGYDATTAVSADYATVNNLDYLSGVLGTDAVNLQLVSADYATAKADTGKQYDYKLTIDNTDYKLAYGTGFTAESVSADGQSAVFTGNDGIINKRKVYVSLADTPAITKVYDGTTSVAQDVTDKILVREGDLLTSLDGTDLDRSATAINARYDTKDAATGKTVTYNVALTGSAADNYEIHRLANIGDAAADTIYSTLEGTGDIGKAVLTLDPTAISKTYNGTAVIGDGTSEGDDAFTADKLTLRGVNNEYFTFTPEAFRKVSGQYGDANVSWDGEEVAHKDLFYTGLSDALAVMNSSDSTNSISKNYTIDNTAYFAAAQAKGQIKPIVITQAATENWKPVIREYNADTDLAEVYDYSGGTKGAQLGIKDILQLTVDDVAGNALTVAYEANGNYDNQNVAGNHVLNYHINSVNKKVSDGTGHANYVLDTSVLEALEGQDLDSSAEGIYSVITPQQLSATIQSATGNRKIYDGTDTADTANFVLDADDQAVLEKDDLLNNVVITAYYDDKHASVAPGAADTNSKSIGYTLSMTDINDNYEIATPTATAQGDIEQRKVYVEPVDVTGIDKVYDSTTAMPEGYSSAGRFALAAADADTGIVAGEEEIQLDTEAIEGAYADGHVHRNADGTLATQDINFTNFTLQDTVSGNDNTVSDYYVATTSLTGSGTIKPSALTVGIKEAPVKVYDGETAISATYAANDNLVLSGLYAGDSANLLIASADYDDANAGTNKGYTYNITIDNDDYELTQGAGLPDIDVTDNGQTGSLTASDGTIERRVLTVSGVADMTKVYDGTTDGVENAAANITLSNYITKDAANLGLTAVATYDNANAGISEDSDELEKHTVTYTLNLGNTNYELEDAVVTGEGTISRKGLTVVATPAAINMGENMPEFTGTVEGLVEADSSLADLFTFAAKAETTNNIPGSYGVYGWYSSRVSGNLGLNYTFAQDAVNDTAFTVTYVNTNMSNPDTKITPTNDIYKNLSSDNSSGFGDTGAAAIEYMDKNGNVVGQEIIDSGEIHGSDIFGETTDDLTNKSTNLANIGIAGNDIVNVEGADAANIAVIEVDGEASIINLGVRSGQDSSAEINNTDESTDSINRINSNNDRNESVAQIAILDDLQVIEEDETDKAEEKEGEIAIESSESGDDEIELKVEAAGVNVA